MTSTTSTLLKEFERAFESARSAVFKTIQEFKIDVAGSRDTDRRTDIKTTIDEAVSDIYLEVAEKHRMFIVGEEQQYQGARDQEGFHWVAKNWHDYKYVLILDPVDATVNMLVGLPFGVNIGFGRINCRDMFCVNDLEAVFVADYQTQRAFRWTADEGLTIRPPVFADKFEWIAEGWELVFEVPDERSYLPKDEKAAKQAQQRQEALVGSFRSVFPDHGRRQIDCTGLRMLEVLARNSVAYGDARGATFVWDVAPSTRIVLAEGKNIRVADAACNTQFLDTPIIRVEDGRGIGTKIKWGETILVAKEQDLAKVRECLNGAFR